MIDGPPPSPPAIALPAEVRNVIAWGDPVALIELRQQMDERGWQWASGNLGGKTAMLYIMPPQDVAAAEIQRLIDDINAGKHGKINAGRGMIGEPAQSPEPAVAVRRCGVPEQAIRVSYDDELESDVVTVGRLSFAPNRSLLRCIYRAQSVTGAFVLFDNRGANDAFRKLSAVEEAREGRRLSLRWLADRRLDVGLPSYTPGAGGLDRFARAVEAHCSVPPGSAVEILGPKMLTLKQTYMQSSVDPRDDSDGMTCLMNVISVSDLDRKGVFFGFIGNEAYSPEKSN